VAGVAAQRPSAFGPLGVEAAPYVLVVVLTGREREVRLRGSHPFPFPSCRAVKVWGRLSFLLLLVPNHKGNCLIVEAQHPRVTG
jgi:hypothetical protein